MTHNANSTTSCSPKYTTSAFPGNVHADMNESNMCTMEGAPPGMCYNPTVQEPFFERIEGISNKRRQIV